MNSLVSSALHWRAGVGNDQLIADHISGCRNIGQKFNRKEPLGLKYMYVYTANPFPHNCTLPENYMHLLAPHENKHPFWLLISKIGTGA